MAGRARLRWWIGWLLDDRVGFGRPTERTRDLISCTVANSLATRGLLPICENLRREIAADPAFLGINALPLLPIVHARFRTHRLRFALTR